MYGLDALLPNNHVLSIKKAVLKLALEVICHVVFKKKTPVKSIININL